MSHYAAAVRKVLLFTLVLNAAVVVIKLLAGMAAGSIALISDAVHSSVDVLNNLVGLFVLRFSTKAADEDHPYGHQKIETLAAFSIAGFLAIACYEIAGTAIGRLTGGVEPDVHVTWVTLGAVLFTLVVNIFVATYEARAGKHLRSHLLIADAAHVRSDVYVTLAVLAGTILVRMGYVHMDAIFAVLVAAFIARAGYHIFMETAPILVDASALPSASIREIAGSIEGVTAVRDIRSRGWEGHYFIDLTISTPTTDAILAHEITEHIEAGLREQFGEATITVHVEPE